MSYEIRDPAQNHIDAIYKLNEVLIRTCGDRFSPEIRRYFDEVLRSFNAFRSGHSGTGTVAEVNDAALGRNYVTGQCTLLLAFVHTVDLLVRKHDVEALRQPLKLLWSDLNDLYNTFFVRQGLRAPPHE